VEKIIETEILHLSRNLKALTLWYIPLYKVKTAFKTESADFLKLGTLLSPFLGI
jgi:hypothetical protein